MAFFVGRWQQVFRDYSWEDGGGDLVEEEIVCDVVDESIDEELPIGVLILQNLNDYPEAVVRSSFFFCSSLYH